MDFQLTKELEDIIKAAKEFALGEFPKRAQKFDSEETFDFDRWKRSDWVAWPATWNVMGL